MCAGATSPAGVADFASVLRRDAITWRRYGGEIAEAAREARVAAHDVMKSEETEKQHQDVVAALVSLGRRYYWGHGLS